VSDRRSQPAAGFRTLIVDDEATARAGLRHLLEADPELLLEEAPGGPEAVESIRAGGVDLVFLDIRMRGMDGFDVIRAVGVANMPVVVFTTAYSAHAIRAFDACALDYLLKPIGEERLAASVVRAKAAVTQRRIGAASEALVSLLAYGAIPKQRRPPFRLLVTSGVSSFYLGADDIDWIESSDNYVRVWASGRTFLVRESMASLQTSLTEHDFVRTHRRALVNIGRVREIRDALGRRAVVLRDGTRVPLSRSRRADVYEALEKRP
jgi:two-component system LytT family response regulator